MAASPLQGKTDDETFPLFPQLPTEIRHEIWSIYANSQPRIIELCLIRDDRANPSYAHRNTNNPFHTPTPLPQSLFAINQESRSIALQAYPLSFPNAHHPPQIRYNPEIDIVFLPRWCFWYHCRDFTAATSAKEKGTIQRLAIEAWLRLDNKHSYIVIDEFRNLREVVLVQRKPDFMGCSYAHTWEAPEWGVAGLRKIEEKNEKDGAKKREGEEVETTMSEDAMAVFLAIREKDSGYRIPTVREMDLTRNGKRCY